MSATISASTSTVLPMDPLHLPANLLDLGLECNEWVLAGCYGLVFEQFLLQTLVLVLNSIHQEFIGVVKIGLILHLVFLLFHIKHQLWMVASGVGRQDVAPQVIAGLPSLPELPNL